MIIGGVTLDHDLIWKDEFEYTPIAGNSARALEGHMVLQAFSLYGGQPMTLSGEINFGWQKRSTVIALQALTVPSGQVFTVTLPDSRVYTVSFRPDEDPVMSFTPITVASAPGVDFWYYGEIRLVIVA